ncbi:MAG: indole-3-glycerol phosphate synthase TrpC [Actinobacteria bacterium]|jgi:indole-3-glycerol phosphate synthase|nr:indole-3-glycerol phosphate synthase TrpC [Actinomycetota bacterium]NCW34414.1 indole-3-glycerol phosphate synthase TrpC [Actinomycetota bacterium]NCZ73516.1 indole-3-glycerol phosphate synthase TrpC [Actinomycetota bacterium]NDA41240.1 indole-3-glycerol phosphate synthase TrpC [Actinomycetota bacterium]NDB30822.1 indole-3-glycerol phosphate synthase TrpC [Actinomycetota bacterium]
MNVLESIIAGVREDEARRRKSPQEIAEMISRAPAVRDAISSLRTNSFSIIAEVKRSSPSKGAISAIQDPVALARTYEAAGARAISVLTEERRFHGSLGDFQSVRTAINLPMLRKDFMVSEYLIRESRAYGADIVLLIVAALDDRELKDLSDCAQGLGMQTLVEVHDEEEVERALKLDATMIGVNARNLKTLEVDLTAFDRLLPLIPDSVLKVAESGIATQQDSRRARSAGASAILVGEALVRSESPANAIRELTEFAN